MYSKVHLVTFFCSVILKKWCFTNAYRQKVERSTLETDKGLSPFVLVDNSAPILLEVYDKQQEKYNAEQVFRRFLLFLWFCSNWVLSPNVTNNLTELVHIPFPI